MKIIEETFDVATGETVRSERNATKLEIDEIEANIVKETELQNKALEKVALLTKLGITADEATLLFG
jgi:hypothetical protein